jgi:hypothetical protein
MAPNSTINPSACGNALDIGPHIQRLAIHREAGAQPSAAGTLRE